MTLDCKNCKIHEYFFLFDCNDWNEDEFFNRVMYTVCEYTVCTSDFETTLYLISSQGHNIAIQATINICLLG